MGAKQGIHFFISQESHSLYIQVTYHRMHWSVLLNSDLPLNAGQRAGWALSWAEPCPGQGPWLSRSLSPGGHHLSQISVCSSDSSPRPQPHITSLLLEAWKWNANLWSRFSLDSAPCSLHDLGLRTLLAHGELWINVIVLLLDIFI